MELSEDTRLMELPASPATTSYGSLLDEQRNLFQNQIEKLQEIVATQCKLTGVNPLSQEMAASALSIKIGKRPRDLLNPKAVKYMQLVFSMKDAISKRETREISAQFGVTVTQVRDFFAGQRTRVRKFVRLSREKANPPASNLMHDGITSTSSSEMPAELIPLATIAPMSIDEGPSSLKRHEDLPGLADPEKHFVENIFGLLRKEESFSGQVKLIRWILRITNPSVLNWFLVEGGLMILATWLSEAAKEEQSNVLLVILKALDYLPVSKALPGHMSAILQSVNRLRFYKASDISHRARTILSKWSKMLGKNLSKKSNGLKSASDLQDEMLLKQSISEVMDSESWDLTKENPEDSMRLRCEISDSSRMLDTAQPLKMLTESGEDSSKRRGVFPPQTRERRKVQLVEHPGQRLAVRSPQVARSTSATQSRPLSADDIQKAKIRAHYMQHKHGKTITPDEKIKSESEKRKSDIENKLTAVSSHPSLATFVSKSNVLSELEEQKKHDDSLPKLPNQLEEQKKYDDSSSKLPNQLEEQKKPDDSISKLPNQLEEQKKPDDSLSKLPNQIEEQGKSDDSLSEVSNPRETSLNLEEPPWKKYKRIQIPWKMPPELKIDEAWSVGDGANSKEVEVQKNRIRREREIVYRTIQEIPSNPREPWDREMDCDDSLTLEIPIDQLPDVETLEAPDNPPMQSSETAGPTPSESMMSEPDFELLAELLKNPELVFALTSGKAGNLSSDETVKLLDRIKAHGASSLGNLAGNANDKVEVSLPSPTPSSDPVPNGVKHDFSRNPFSRQQGLANGNSYQNMVSQIPATAILTPQPSATVQHYAHKSPASLQASVQLHEQWQQPHTNQQFYHQSRLNSSNAQHFTSERLQSPNTKANASPSPANWAGPSGPSRSATPPDRSLRSRHGYESNYPYQNNRSYAGGSAGAWQRPERPKYESWSPDNSPSRRHEYLPGPHHNEASASSRNGYRHGKGMQQNLVQHSSYQDGRNKQWQDRRR